jgi:hypothetical protein
MVTPPPWPPPFVAELPPQPKDETKIRMRDRVKSVEHNGSLTKKPF